MNLYCELTLKPPQTRVQGTIVRGPYFSGGEVKPTGRPADTGRRLKILEALEDGPATRAELAALTGMKSDAVKHVLYSMLNDGVIKVEHDVVRGLGKIALWRKA